MTICKFCGDDRKLVRSHIIPEAFFRANRGDDDKLYMLSSAPGDFPKRARLGVYDEELLCDPCEMRFQRMDDYAAKVLLNEFDDLFIRTKVDDQTSVFIGDANIDQDLLLRFCVGLLWRAAATTQPFFSNITVIDAYLWAAQGVIAHPTSRVPRVFEALLSRKVASEERKVFATSIISPTRHSLQSRSSGFHFNLGMNKLMINVGLPRLRDPWDQVLVGRSNPRLIVQAYEFDRSVDMWNLFHTVARSRLPGDREMPGN